MKAQQYILSIDQGTTSSRAMIVNQEGQCLAQAQENFTQHFPHAGWVEHQADEIWHSVYNCCKKVLNSLALTAQDIAGMGITNQRETTLVWDRRTGKTLYPAIVWQDRRTQDLCHSLREQGLAPLVAQKTGLVLDPYFSATKIGWILDNVPGARHSAEQGHLAFGTIDSYLIWRLTHGKQHLTDATNASRTLLFNIHSQEWDEALLRSFNIPHNMLPTVKDCCDDFGSTAADLFGGEIPIYAVAGDQQAAAIGQACIHPGMAKVTYGTGGFLIVNTGEQAIPSQHNLLTTIAYRINKQTTYALEGSFYMAGATIQWLRDKLKCIKSAAESEQLASQAAPNHNVYLVPAFTGLGAPYWNSEVKAAIYGLTRDSSIEDITAAALEASCYQTCDLLHCLTKDGIHVNHLHVDGGLSTNYYFLQKLADLTNINVDRPVQHESTALGAAYLAGIKAGLFDSLDALQHLRTCDIAVKAKQNSDWRAQKYEGWLHAVRKTLA